MTSSSQEHVKQCQLTFEAPDPAFWASRAQIPSILTRLSSRAILTAGFSGATEGSGGGSRLLSEGCAQLLWTVQRSFAHFEFDRSVDEGGGDDIVSGPELKKARAVPVFLRKDKKRVLL